MLIQPYLMFNGNCEAAFTFYEKALGGKIVAMARFGEMPADAMGGDGCTDTSGGLPPGFEQKIMHTSLQVGDQVLMASDSHPMYPYNGIHGMSIALGFTDVAEGEKVFAALSDGATVTMPLAETFWSERFGMLEDKFGVSWMVNAGAQKK